MPSGCPMSACNAEMHGHQMHLHCSQYAPVTFERRQLKWCPNHSRQRHLFGPRPSTKPEDATAVRQRQREAAILQAGRGEVCCLVDEGTRVLRGHAAC